MIEIHPQAVALGDFPRNVRLRVCGGIYPAVVPEFLERGVRDRPGVKDRQISVMTDAWRFTLDEKDIRGIARESISDELGESGVHGGINPWMSRTLAILPPG